jgi:hypothetical protein
MAEPIWSKNPELRAQGAAEREIFAKEKLNGRSKGEPPESTDKTKAYQDLATKIADLALTKLVDPIKYQLDLPDAVETLGIGVRRLEGLIKPIYQRLARQRGGESDGSERPGQRDEVEAIGQACELFCDTDGEAYATVGSAGHKETWPVFSKRFKRYVLSEYRRQHGRLAGKHGDRRGDRRHCCDSIRGPGLRGVRAHRRRRREDLPRFMPRRLEGGRNRRGRLADPRRCAGTVPAADRFAPAAAAVPRRARDLPVAPARQRSGRAGVEALRVLVRLLFFTEGPVPHPARQR